ncbi:MAG: acyl carrier protein [Microcystis sp. M038S2]|uniref:Acyl carrier protein n=2 Tax=Microcystis TaxID=1125 RepID=A0A966L3V4_MICAE|nr:acyl carrier protein [Microcystis sp. M046S2]MCA2703521.1 acyl carrier protein [Microcystis sp. M038S2]MCA2948351.1 acyl carrier protein [Microcystis sp. M109S1]MCA2951011.1 acyl carrier protein [Microcystis sp. M112S1]NCR25321.1 acyl carrier protein [Microcystis aeruginosa LE13-04]NCS01971.1 acyl carrier protein [Microcystis aeruginosa G13-11]NCS38335.1 acyl carrier protein [Microcystis aeruginosa BS13-10]NCS56198.1 acyl carrier protein [Microcystis aeruginosa G11-04]TRU55061.1 MAG: acy
MNEDSKNYEMQILAMMINQYLDDMVSLSEEKLNQLEANCDQIVWDLATRIYKESGHKVEFHIIRNLINSRIAVMRYQLFFSKSSLLESKRIDEEKAMKIAEQKANAIINDKKIDDTEKITSQENERQLAIFIKVQEIISDQLEVEKSQIHIEDELFYLQSAERVSSYSSDSFYSSYSSFGWNSCLLSNWGGDDLDTIELIAALEEEFDLELSDEKCQEFTTVKKLVDYLAENLCK